MLCRRGRQYAEDFMKTKCNLLPVEDNMQSVGTAAFLQFLQPMRGISGTLMLGSQEPWNPFTVCCPTVGFSVGLSFEVCSHIICGRYVVASLDVTVFPANAERVKGGLRHHLQCLQHVKLALWLDHDAGPSSPDKPASPHETSPSH